VATNRLLRRIRYWRIGMELNSVFGEVTLVQALLHSMCLRTPEKGKPAPRGACSVQRLQAANANSTGSSEWGCLLSQQKPTVQGIRLFYPYLSMYQQVLARYCKVETAPIVHVFSDGQRTRRYFHWCPPDTFDKMLHFAWLGRRLLTSSFEAPRLIQR